MAHSTEGLQGLSMGQGIQGIHGTQYGPGTSLANAFRSQHKRAFVTARPSLQMARTTLMRTNFMT
jgi:hypothetical protein